MNTQLKDQFSDAAEGVPAFGSYPGILERGRTLRRRRRIQIGSIAASVGIVLASSFAALQLNSHDDGVTPSQPPSSSDTTDSLDGWAPNVTGEAAAPGTSLYRDCSSQCRTFLAQPGTTTIDLSAARPDLQPLLEKAPMDRVTISYDAKWLGVPDGGAYVITALEPDAPLNIVPAGAAASTWQPVGWNVSSGSLALAQTVGTNTTAYAQVDTSDPLGNAKVHVLDKNPLPGWVAVANGGDSVQVAKPSAENSALIDTRLVFINSDQFAPGDTIDPRSTPLDLSSCLGPDETLTGPAGVPVIATPPAPDGTNATEGDQTNAVYVFSDTADKTVRAVIAMDCAGARGSRYDVRSAEGIDGLVAPIPATTASSLLVERGQDRVTLREVFAGNNEGEPVLTLPPTAEVVAPGAFTTIPR